MTTKAFISTDDSALDTLDAVEWIELAGSALKPGMVLVDVDLYTPVAVIDHRTRAPRNSGASEYLALDLEQHRYTTVSVGPRSMIKVMAA